MKKLKKGDTIYVVNDGEPLKVTVDLGGYPRERMRVQSEWCQGRAYAAYMPTNDGFKYLFCIKCYLIWKIITSKGNYKGE